MCVCVCVCVCDSCRSKLTNAFSSSKSASSLPVLTLIHTNEAQGLIIHVLGVINGTVYVNKYPPDTTTLAITLIP